MIFLIGISLTLKDSIYLYSNVVLDAELIVGTSTLKAVHQLLSEAYGDL